MRIHRILLRNVKGVVERALEFPDSGVVVIEGPNEVGKSTFLEALDRLLEPRAKASSKAASIVGLQPVGQDVGPFVEVEMTIGSHRLVFAKRWLRQPSTTLRLLSPVPEQLVGEAAQQRMDAIMDSSVDRPLLDALRFAQSGSSGPIRLADSAVLAAALDGASGADLHSTGSGDLLGAVEIEYRRYYTANTGQPAGEFRAAIADAYETQMAVVEADRRVSEAAIHLSKRDEAADLHHVAKTAIPPLEKVLRTAQRAAEQVSGLRDEEQHAARRAASSSLSTRAAEGLVVARQGLVDDAAQRAVAAQLLASRAAAAVQREQERDESLTEATDIWDHARDEWARMYDDAESAAVAARRLQLHAEVAALEDRMAAVDAASEDLSQHRHTISEAAVTPAVWRDLERHQQELAIADAAVEAGSTVVTVGALREGQNVKYDGLAHTLSPSGPGVQVSTARESELIINGSVRVAITPHADVVQRVAYRDQVRGQLAGALAEVNAADLEQAALMHQAHLRVRDHLAQAEGDLAVALSGSSVADLRELLEHRRQALLDGDLESASPRVDDRVGLGVTRDDVDHAVNLLASLQTQLRPLRKAKDEAEDEVQRVRKLQVASGRARDIAVSQHEAACAESQRASERIDAERKTTSDVALASAVTEATKAEEIAVADHRVIEGALLAANAVEADQHLTKASGALAHARAEQERLGNVLQNFNGQLEATAGEGRQETYERAVQAFDESNRALSSLDRRARAARQLHQTLQRHRERAHANYVAPYSQEIERLGRSLYGDSFGIAISPSLVITHRHLHGDTVAFEHLSGGAKEQLGLVARLAVALLVESDQSVPVVIDDALGYTDPQRLQSLGTLLGRNDHRGQIILLTCTPQRYRAIPGASTVRLSA